MELRFTPTAGRRLFASSSGEIKLRLTDERATLFLGSDCARPVPGLRVGHELFLRSPAGPLLQARILPGIGESGFRLHLRHELRAPARPGDSQLSRDLAFDPETGQFATSDGRFSAQLLEGGRFVGQLHLAEDEEQLLEGLSGREATLVTLVDGPAFLLDVRDGAPGQLRICGCEPLVALPADDADARELFAALPPQEFVRDPDGAALREMVAVLAREADRELLESQR